MSAMQPKIVLPLKRIDRKTPLDTSYLSNKSPGLKASSSVAQFMARSKGNNMSFQMNPANGLELSLCKIVTQTPGKSNAKRHMRASKSCGKNCRLNASDNERLDLSMQQHARLESIYLPDRKHLLSSSTYKNKELMASAKPPQRTDTCPGRNKGRTQKDKLDITVGSTLSKISEELRWIKSGKQKGSPTHLMAAREGTPHGNLAASSHTIYSSGKMVSEFALQSYNTTGPQTLAQAYVQGKPRRRQNPPQSTNTRVERRIATSVKRKRSRESGVKHRPGETNEQESGRDSGTNLTDNTTAHTAKLLKQLGDDSHAKLAENARSLANGLIAGLKEIEAAKDSLKDGEAASKKSLILSETMNGVICADPYFGDVLRQLQIVSGECQDQFKKETANLAEENIRLKKELEAAKTRTEQAERDKREAEAVAVKQQNDIAELKSALGECHKAASEGKEVYELKIQELGEDINALYKENRKLALVAKKLFVELRHSKKREQTLTKLLKGEAPEGAGETGVVLLQDKGKKLQEPAEEKKESAINKTAVIEVGKKKVKVPVLDFSRLAPKKPSKLKVVKYYKGDASSEVSADGESGQGIEILDEEFDRKFSVLHFVEAMSDSEEVSESKQEDGEEDLDGALDNFLGKIGEISASITSSAKTH